MIRAYQCADPRVVRGRSLKCQQIVTGISAVSRRMQSTFSSAACPPQNPLNLRRTGPEPLGMRQKPPAVPGWPQISRTCKQVIVVTSRWRQQRNMAPGCGPQSKTQQPGCRLSPASRHSNIGVSAVYPVEGEAKDETLMSGLTDSNLTDSMGCFRRGSTGEFGKTCQARPSEFQPLTETIQ
jgi:hypothetical protein